ncbi:MAG: TraR/DksA family transcriptional regulator [Candidatus Omnitrophica bacterium]|nr:TraR/DksA family transcriptional regulator [Candidatus Omnitrophota bacterium]
MKLKRKKVKKVKKMKTGAQPKPKKVKSIFSKAALKKFKAALLKLREKLMGEVTHLTDDTLKQSQKDASGDLSGYTLHLADMATDHYDREFALGIASTEQGVVYAIDEALKRIDDDSYGICFTCDKPITKKRLIAVPHAKYCVSCQQKEELLDKQDIKT